MAVAFDAVSSNFYGNANTVSFTHTPVGTPTNVGLGLSFNSISVIPGIQTLTYGGVSCTRTNQVIITGGTYPAYYAEIWELANPPSGPQTVFVTFNTAGNYGSIGVVTVTGGDTAQTFSNNNTASGTGSTASGSCTSAIGELVMTSMFGVLDTATATATGTGETERWNGAFNTIEGAGSTIPGAASVSSSWTRSGTTTDDGWGLCLASFKAAGVAPSRVPYTPTPQLGPMLAS